MEYRVRPSTGDGDTDDKIRDMINTKDPENIAQADDLASMLGYESDEPFSKSDLEYDRVSLVSKYSKLLDRMGIAMPALPHGIKLIDIEEDHANFHGRFDIVKLEVEDIKLALEIEFKQLENNADQSTARVSVHVFNVTDDGMYDHKDTVGGPGDNGAPVERLPDLIKDIYERHIKPKQMSDIFKSLTQ